MCLFGDKFTAEFYLACCELFQSIFSFFFSFSFAILSNYLPTARLLFTPLIGHLCISQTVHTNRKLILMFCGVEVSIPKCEVFDLKTVVCRMYDLKDPREV